MNRVTFLLCCFALGAAPAPLAQDDDQGAVSQKELKRIFREVVRGDHDRLDLLVAHGQEILPWLLDRAGAENPDRRSAALFVLHQIDANDGDGAVSRPEVIGVLIQAIQDPEADVLVVDEALRGLMLVSPESRLQPEWTDALFARLDTGQARAALILGRIGDASLIPALEARYSSPDGSVRHAAMLAAARLGDQSALAYLLSSLDVEGPERNRAMIDLAYVKSRASVRAIARYLDHPGIPVSADLDVRHTPYRFVAAWALGEIVENPVVRRHDASLIHESDVESWRQWWREHQSEYP